MSHDSLPVFASMEKRLRIGISACFMHKDPTREIFKGKTLLYIEESLAHWVMRLGAQAFMIPTVSARGQVSPEDYAAELDGLVLHGGADVAPESYGEKPLRPEWQGDRVRDLYEIALFEAFRRVEKPILGICRGAQLINVALGGSLYQDINTALPNAFKHRDWQIYDQNFHEVEFVPGSYLERLFGRGPHKVNSVHHQALKDIGRNLRVEAYSITDRIVEGITYTGDSYICGIQWHPEFHDENDPTLLSGDPLLADFMRACSERKKALAIR
ncbi:MAG: gamma-glutamyl-gamma-aminobutyrate hydrolase family protein [Turneriella sp.]|nr:gamma-glutamyl-gamma-aminobutyrate hydrolase family protein [Turneriella sp.]